MSKRKSKKKQKITISIISAIIILLLIICGANPETINQFANLAGIDITIENKEVAQEVTNTTVVDGDLNIYFIDVGQADSILLTNKESSLLIDAGNNEDGEVVVNFIKEKGITKLDYVIGTHPHEDHIGGLDDVINSSLEIENIYMPKIQTNTKTFEDVLDAVKNKGLQVTAPQKGDTFQIGEAKAEIMTDSILDEDNLNLSSITIRLQYGNNSFLFMGDSETENEETRTWPKTDVLKVGHHGSNTSSSEDFLNQVKPTYAIIMAGKNNSYGLPKDKILERLKNIGSQIYRTDEEGTIVMTSDGNQIEIK